MLCRPLQWINDLSMLMVDFVFRVDLIHTEEYGRISVSLLSKKIGLQ